MLKGPQLRPSEQRKRLKRYLRVLRANYNRAWRELEEVFRIRKGCPFEHSLRYHRFDEARKLLELAEKCLKEVNHCYALRLAAFQPGAQIVVTITMRGFEPRPTRYLILDVEWSKGDEYHYVVHEITKTGTLHKGRYPHWVSPSNRIAIELCDEPLPEETRWRAQARRDATKALFEAVLQRGDLAMFELPKPHPAPAPRPQYPFWATSTPFP